MDLYKIILLHNKFKINNKLNNKKTMNNNKYKLMIY